ncbi:hypothetical protein D3C71_1766240 [compost metagenome]
MDEAERCHRLAILDQGVLVADGSPAELTDALRGRTLEVHATQPRKAQRLLAAAPGVLSVAQIGNTLRVLLAQVDDGPERLQQVLRAGGQPAEVLAAPANLEDVFVSATRGRTPAAEPAP